MSGAVRRAAPRAFRPHVARAAGIACAVTATLACHCAAGAAEEPSARGPTICWTPSADEPARIVVEVTGLDAAALASLRRDSKTWDEAQWQSLLAVRTAGSALPMLGTHRAGEHALKFEPRFAFTPGVTCHATFDPSRLPGGAGGMKPATSAFTLPAPRREPVTTVTRIFPGSAELPENLLKFYVHFSAPMSRGQIYQYIHLRDNSGKDVELPFLEIDEELWDRDLKRLTLFIDPGRIKREVRPLEEIGPALTAGKTFTLAIDASWTDAAGAPLREPHVKRFRVAPPDRTPIDPSQWKLSAPARGSREPLRIDFTEPMDHALALRLLRVTCAADGTAIGGAAALTDAERRWSFTPDQPWPAGTHHLIVPVTLEDLAGNNVGKAFEVDLTGQGAERLTTESVKLPFDVK